MGRTALGKLSLTLEELEWVANATERRMNKPELMKSEREQKIVQRLNEKVNHILANPPTNPRDPFILETSRAEARYIQRVATGVRNALITRIIPGYENKGAEREEYQKAAQVKANMLNVIFNKVAKTL
jgi:hypothetical protein